MNLNKSLDFYKPDSTRIHIIGCGSVGSTIAENLVRCGQTKLTLWDFDKVESHNIVNQMFRSQDIGRLKVEALKDLLVEINPEIESTNSIKIKPEGWQGESLTGYVFLCVDDIEIRRNFVEGHKNNAMIKAVFDVRTRLTDAQAYAADWADGKEIENLLNSMQFSHDEATESTPQSSCGITLGVATTVRVVCALQVNNYINFVKTGKLKRLILADAFGFRTEAFPESESA